MHSKAAHIVVGYDGSSAAEAAVDWAAAEAERRQVPLQVMHVVDYGLVQGPVGPVPWRPDLIGQRAGEMTAQGVERARKLALTVPVTAQTRICAVAFGLVEASRTASLLVVGTRGHGDLVGTALGSVAFAVSAHAFSPVVVVRGSGA